MKRPKNSIVIIFYKRVYSLKIILVPFYLKRKVIYVGILKTFAVFTEFHQLYFW